MVPGAGAFLVPSGPCDFFCCSRLLITAPFDVVGVTLFNLGVSNGALCSILAPSKLNSRNAGKNRGTMSFSSPPISAELFFRSPSVREGEIFSDLLRGHSTFEKGSSDSLPALPGRGLRGLFFNSNGKNEESSLKNAIKLFSNALRAITRFEIEFSKINLSPFPYSTGEISSRHSVLHLRLGCRHELPIRKHGQ